MQVIKQRAEEFEAFQKGGFAGLKAYKMAQLIQSGVNPEYLKMTPQQLQDFLRASDVAERAMLPNFMTDEDRALYREQMAKGKRQRREQRRAFDEENYAEVNGQRMGLSEILGGAPIRINIGKGNDLELTSDAEQFRLRNYETDSNGRITQMTERDFTLPNIDDVAQSFSEMPPAIQSVTESLSEIPQAVLGVAENIAQIVSPQIESVVQNFSGGIREVTVKLSDFARIISEISAPNNYVEPVDRQPVEVNTTVQIDEAHAWDSKHIQELADKVADVLLPKITSAIGGDANSYG